VNGKLNVRASTPAMIRVETNLSDINQVSGIEIGIPAFSSLNSCKIISTTIGGDRGNLQYNVTGQQWCKTRNKLKLYEHIEKGENNE
jgi:hypothetical protein